MRHATPAALEMIADFLARVRREPRLRERKFAIFYAHGRAFLHFHEGPRGLFADFREDGAWARYPVSTAREQNALLARVKKALAN